MFAKWIKLEVICCTAVIAIFERISFAEQSLLGAEAFMKEIGSEIYSHRRKHIRNAARVAKCN